LHDRVDVTLGIGYINIEKNIRLNNIKSPKMLTLRFFFPSVYIYIYTRIHSLSSLLASTAAWPCNTQLGLPNDEIEILSSGS
jgi:hypothetical protein